MLIAHSINYRVMKLNAFLFLFFISCLSANGQLSIFGEMAANPFKGDNSIITKNLSLGLSYKLSDKWVLRTGLSSFDIREGSSNEGFVEIFIPGSIPTFDYSSLNHLFDIHSTSIFLGVQSDFGKWRFNLDIHQVFVQLSNERIAVSESPFIPDPEIRLFDSSYENLRFAKMNFSIGYEVIKKSRGSLYLFARFSQGYLGNEGTLEVLDYDPELIPYLNSLPGTNPETAMSYLQGADVYYDSRMLFLGLQFSYHLVGRNESTD